MGNEQSGQSIDGADSAGATPSVPSTPRPILRNPAAAAAGGGGGGGSGAQPTSSGGGGEEKNRRSVVFRDQTEDALRLNRSIMRAGNAAAAAAAAGAANAAFYAGQQRALPPGGLARLSQQVNDINGAGAQRPPAAEAGGGGGGGGDASRRAAAPVGVRTQKPPAPAPPPQTSTTTTGATTATGRTNRQGGDEETGDTRAVRMREHVFALAKGREMRATAGSADLLDSGGGRLYDPSVQELPTVAEEKEEREVPSKRRAVSHSQLAKTDSTEALKEEIKQEILSELLSRPASSSKAVQQSAEAATSTPDAAGKLAESEKRRLIAEIRQQLLGEQLTLERHYDANGGTPEPDYPDDALAASQQGAYAGPSRFASEMELHHSGAANGHYRGPQQQQPRRVKGPAPAPPNARYRRGAGGGPPVVREPYQAQWEEPIYAYDGPPQSLSSEQQQQQQQQQMEKAYDDRYRQKSRNKRFGDSWKRMTASLSKAFGFSGGAGNGAGGGGGSGGSGGGKSAGVGRRSSVRDTTFERPSDLHQLRAFADSRAGSLYSLASAEMPPLEHEHQQLHQQQRQSHRRSEYFPPPAEAADIWRDVAKASHDQMLHTTNPVFGAPDLSTPADADDGGRSARGGHRGSNGHAGGAAAKSPQEQQQQLSNSSGAAAAAARTAVPAPKVNSHGHQTYL